MDYLKVIENINRKLQVNDRQRLAEVVTARVRASSTGSELLMSATSELLVAIRNDSQLESIIGEEVKGLKSYCRSQGLYVK